MTSSTSDQDRRARETAVTIAARFLSGRDGVGPDRLFLTAELVRTYIAHGEAHVLSARGRKAAASPRR